MVDTSQGAHESQPDAVAAEEPALLKEDQTTTERADFNKADSNLGPIAILAWLLILLGIGAIIATVNVEDPVASAVWSTLITPCFIVGGLAFLANLVLADILKALWADRGR